MDSDIREVIGKDSLIKWLKRRPVRVIPYDHVYLVPTFINRRKLGAGKKLAYGWQVEIPIANEIGVKVKQDFKDPSIHDQQTPLVEAEVYLAQRIEESRIIQDFILNSGKRYLVTPTRKPRVGGVSDARASGEGTSAEAPKKRGRGRPVGSINRTKRPAPLESQLVMRRVADQVLKDNGEPGITSHDDALQQVTTVLSKQRKQQMSHENQPEEAALAHSAPAKEIPQTGVTDGENKDEDSWLKSLKKKTKRIFGKP